MREGSWRFIHRSLFFLGFLLSPLTFWNDAFVNIPLSYAVASLLTKVVNVKFVNLMIICYYLTNILGLFMMYGSGKGAIRKGRIMVRDVIITVLTVSIYTLVLIFLNSLGILRPF